MMKNSGSAYGSVAKVFHWLLFLAFCVLIVSGNLLADMPKGPDKFQAAGMHKSFGLLVLILVLVRLGWRLTNVSPKPPAGLSPVLAFLGEAMHWGLYVLMLAQPVTGILMSQAAGAPTGFFGLLDLPVLLSKNPDLAKAFRGAHGLVWFLLVIAVVGHAGAGVYHHVIRKDGVLKRMWFGGSKA